MIVAVLYYFILEMMPVKAILQSTDFTDYKKRMNHILALKRLVFIILMGLEIGILYYQYEGI